MKMKSQYLSNKHYGWITIKLRRDCNKKIIIQKDKVEPI